MSADQNIYYTGNQISVEATLQLNGTPLPLDGLTIQARLIDRTRTGRAAGTSVVTCTKPGAVGKANAVWQSGETGAIVPGVYMVEFTTTDGPFTHEGVEITILQGVA